MADPSRPSAPAPRPGGRGPQDLRPVRLARAFTKHAAGSVLVAFGDTQVLCTACVESGVPPFLRGREQGWLTAEYGMLPGATHTRGDREAARGRQSGRTQEIQRLIGRSLRGAVDLGGIGERTIRIDCDVLQADGGTRTAAITGACVALHDALRSIDALDAFRGLVASVSVGLVGGVPVLDLEYVEDVAADTDMNVVMTEAGGFMEVQGTAEGEPLPRPQLDALLDVAAVGIRELIDAQRRALGLR